VTGRSERLLDPLDRRFSVESGAESLCAEFATVEVKQTIGKLRLTGDDGIAALLRYYRSVDDEWSAAYAIPWPDLEAALTVIVQDRMRADGTIEISTCSGLLIAR
jgi:hypothetical protein